uniref:ABC-type xenobiotic transporter n=1 Tax=Ditylenchus dipsaci TaxID=166011 RepID=A0A915EGH1_9BILA
MGVRKSFSGLPSVKKFKKSNELKFKSASFLETLRYAETFDWILLVVGIVANVLTGAVSPLNSFIFRGISDALMEGQFRHENGTLDIEDFSAKIIKHVWMYFLLGVVSLILINVAVACFFTLCERQVHRIRKKFFEAILNQDMCWFDSNEVGALTQKMSSGIERMKDGLSDKIAIVIQAFATMIGGISIGLYMSWQMTLVTVVVFPFIVLSLYGSARVISSSLRNEMSAYASAGAVADEVIGGIRTVAAFNAQYYEITRYEKFLKIGRKMGINKALLVAMFAGLYLFILFVSMGIAFWFGSTMVLSGVMSPGTVFAVFWAVLIGAFRMGQAVPQINVIVGAKLAAGDIFSIIDRKPALDSSSKAGIKLETVMGRLEFCNIHFSYPTRPDVKILNGVSFTVEPGQTVALVGHSGCGKSTMVSLLMRYYNLMQGSLTIDGVPIQDLNVEWLRNTIAICLQMANAHEFIVKLADGYKTLIGEGGVRLSGGQKQRLAIARALVRNPKILLLDEATSALDTESESIVQQAIDQASTGRTTVTIAHRLSTVRNADKIIVFDKGQIVEAGTHDELIKSDGAYRQLILAQEIVRSPEEEADTAISDDESSEVQTQRHRRPTFSRASSQESLKDLARLARASDRIRMSMSSVKSAASFEFDETMENLEEEGAKPASLMEILLIYGRMFLALSATIGEDVEEARTESFINAILFACLGVVSGLTTFASGSLLGMVGEKMTMRLRLDVFRNIVRQDGSFFDDTAHSTGKLTTRLATDATNVQAAIDQRLAEVLQGLISLVAGVIVAFYFGWNVAPIGLATALLLVILQTSVSNYLKRRGMKDIIVAEEASRIATESIEYVRTVQALTRQKSALIRGFWQSLSYALSNSFVGFNFSAAYLFGLFMIRGGYTTPYVVFQVIEALNMASITIIMTAVTPIKGNIELSNVHFAYPNGRQQLILNGFSMSALFGKTVALVGPSGCGKSTVIQLVERYYDVLSGSVAVDGVDIRKYNIRHLRQAMSLVGQEPTLFNLSIRENIGYGIMDTVTDQQIEAAAKLANIHAFVDSLPEKYDTSVGSKGGQLSGGQKQRIAIARAIIRDPKILLLDEATSALDTESEKVVQEALDRARAGRTCLVIAHRLSTIQHADLIIVVRDGRVVELGNHHQLLIRKGLYYRLVEKQSK